MSDLAYILSLRVSPKNVTQMTLDLRDLAAAVAAEEARAGEIEVFSVLCGLDDPGTFVIYGQHMRAHTERHLAGPLAEPRFRAVQTHLIEPYERVELEPVGLWGKDVGLTSDLTAHEAWLFTVRVPPGGESRYEDLADGVMAAMGEEEFPTNDVITYNVHRVVGDPGRYVMFEHFTNVGSKTHAQGAKVRLHGIEQYRGLVPPFSRVKFAPIVALGAAHSQFGGAAPATRSETASGARDSAVDRIAHRDADWQSRVQGLLDRQEILDCIQRCARGMDRHDAELFAAAYHPDAVDDHGTYRGPASEFVGYLNGTGDATGAHAARFTMHQHFLANHVVELHDQEAHAETYFVFVGELRDRQGLSVTGGRYIDHLIRSDGRWAIIARRVVIEWASELPSGDGMPEEVLRTFTRGAWDRSDISYQRPLLVRTGQDE